MRVGHGAAGALQHAGHRSAGEQEDAGHEQGDGHDVGAEVGEERGDAAIEDLADDSPV